MDTGMCSTEKRRGTHIHCNVILLTDLLVELLHAVRQSSPATVNSSGTATVNSSSTAVVNSSSQT